MSNTRRVAIRVYHGGEMIQEGDTISYSCPPCGYTRVDRNIDLNGLKLKLHEMLGVDESQFKLKVYTMWVEAYGDRFKESTVQIENDANLRFFLDPTDGVNTMKIFIEKEQNISLNMHDQMRMSQDWGAYMSLLSEQDLLGSSTSTLNVELPQNFRADIMPSVTSGFESLGISNVHGGGSTSYPSLYQEAPTNILSQSVDHEFCEPSNDNDPIADSFGLISPNVSEDEDMEVLLDHDNDDDEDEVGEDEEVVVEAGVSSLGAIAHTTTEHTLPPFYTSVEPEIYVDSMYNPSVELSKFYDHDRGVLEKGMLFSSKGCLISAVKNFSVKHARREYRVVESSPTLWKAKCNHSSQTLHCPWFVRGSFKKRYGKFMITKYGGEHQCYMKDMTTDHRNLDKNYIAKILEHNVREDPTIKVKGAKASVKAVVQFDLSYTKAWYGIKRAIENIYGTWESSVKKLPKLLGALQKWNPGTIVEWDHHDTNHPDKKIIKYVFWAFEPCVTGFKYCRPLISVDGTFLYTKYKHKMLIAVGIDGNNQVLPLAFAIVDEENVMSWMWFLKLVCRHIISGREHMCIISDRNAGLLSAIDSLSEFRPPRGASRFCLRHVSSNFNSHFKDICLKDLCWRAGSEHQIVKHNSVMDQIKGLNPSAHAYLARIPKEQWTLAHDEGWRHGILTTNASESFNGVLKGARRLPLTAIVEITFNRCVLYFRERAIDCKRMEIRGQTYATKAHEKFQYWSKMSVGHFVSHVDYSEQSAMVVTRARPGKGGHIHAVKISTRDCSCGKWTLYGIPCSHAMCVCADLRINTEAMVKPYYLLRNYRCTYASSFQPYLGEEYWDEPDFQLFHDATLRSRPRPGRYRTSRIQNEMDWRQTRARQQARRQQVSTHQDSHQ